LAQLPADPVNGIYLFGKDRIKEVIRRNAGLDAEGIRRAIFNAVENFRGKAPQEDDITLVVAKFL
jgi:sigma-B regulation protein RsbU (phosphoserine phosphatase)